jgi:hypothetical protein
MLAMSALRRMRVHLFHNSDFIVWYLQQARKVFV